MEVERAVADVQQGRRHDLAVIGEDDELGVERKDGADGLGRPQSIGGEDRADAELLGGIGDDRGPRPLAATRGTWRRRHDADEIDVIAALEPPEALPSECATPQEHGPDPSRTGRPVRHARAPVASRTSASSSLPSPTAMSSSIDSR